MISTEYISDRIKRTTFQLLETVHIIENSSAPDTVIGRFNFLLEIVPYLQQWCEDTRYMFDIQAGIDQYKLLHYDQLPTETGILILTKPKVNAYNEIFCVCVFNSLGRQFEKFIEAIESLKLESAKEKRRTKMLESLKMVREEIINRSQNSSSAKNILGTIDEIEDIIVSKTPSRNLNIIKK